MFKHKKIYIICISLLLASCGGNTNTPIIKSPASTDSNNSSSTATTLKYKEVISPKTGLVWLDRNLGATKVCTINTKNQKACFGDYYQWGRARDGHEKVDSNTSTMFPDALENTNDKFIISGYEEWFISKDNDGKKRMEFWSKTDGTSICPIGFRVPTAEELKIELAGEFLNNIMQGFLKLPMSGHRRGDDGKWYNSSVAIWSATHNANIQGAKYIGYGGGNSTATLYSSGDKSSGYNVRCIKNSK